MRDAPVSLAELFERTSDCLVYFDVPSLRHPSQFDRTAEDLRLSRLSRLDGPDVRRRVRLDPRLACLPLVMLTSSREEQVIARSDAPGANSHLRKPVDFDNFLTAFGQLGLDRLLLNEAPIGSRTPP